MGIAITQYATDRYSADQVIIRISHDDYTVVMNAAEEIGRVSADRWNVQGYNITSNLGFWKGERENGASIEIIVRDTLTNEDMLLLRNHVTAMGLTAFVTVNHITAFELY